MKIAKLTILFVLGTLGILSVLGFMLLNQTDHSESLSDITIQQKWELPKDLNEISGIAWLNDETIASVQDEDGVIFIYDLKSNKVVDRIEFAGNGDYEGIAINGDNAYVMRSDGVIYEVLRFRESGKKISSFNTGFSSKNNVESLTYDAQNSSLIAAPKDRDQSDDFKGLYQIPLDSKMMNAQPSIKINMNDGAFKDYKKKKAYKTFSPSDVAIHPKTGEYYVLEGKNPKLVILDKDGTITKVHVLDKKIFEQPEGITFSPDGTLYISNEAGNKPANIMEVAFK